jgi:hypothetical protein
MLHLKGMLRRDKENGIKEIKGEELGGRNNNRNYNRKVCQVTRMEGGKAISKKT